MKAVNARGKTERNSDKSKSCFSNLEVYRELGAARASLAGENIENAKDSQ
jgi:hypothetical protein